MNREISLLDLHQDGLLLRSTWLLTRPASVKQQGKPAPLLLPAHLPDASLVGSTLLSCSASANKPPPLLW